jgi:UrcA family protein
MKLFTTTLLAGAFGLAFASAASAQDYQTSEDIQITAPRFKIQSTHPNGPLEKVSLSTHVRYDDLDLRTRRGAWELKARVRDAAQDTCMRVAEAYPFYQQFGTNCYKTALENGELRANAAIRSARDRAYYASYYRD